MDDKWLVTLDTNRVTEAVEEIRRLGCKVALEAAVPIEGDSVVPVSAPESAEAKLRQVPGVKAVHPNSDFTLYTDR